MVILLEVSERDEGVVALHLPSGLLKTLSELEPVLDANPVPVEAGERSVHDCSSEIDLRQTVTTGDLFIDILLLYL